MHPLAQSLIAAIDKFTNLTGRCVAWLTVAMVFITCLVVVLRYGFSMGTPKLQESVAYLHAMVFLLGAAYTLQQDGHVRVDIFYRSYKPSQKAWVNALGAILFLLPVSLFIIFVSYEYVLSSWEVLESSPNADGIPAVFLLKTLIPFAAFTLALQGLAEVIRSSLIVVAEHKA